MLPRALTRACAPPAQVALVVTGHEHAYSRTCPLYK
jgi:hypothetical protein